MKTVLLSSGVSARVVSVRVVVAACGLVAPAGCSLLRVSGDKTSGSPAHFTAGMSVPLGKK